MPPSSLQRKSFRPHFNGVPLPAHKLSSTLLFLQSWLDPLTPRDRESRPARPLLKGQARLQARDMLPWAPRSPRRCLSPCVSRRINSLLCIAPVGGCELEIRTARRVSIATVCPAGVLPWRCRRAARKCSSAWWHAGSALSLLVSPSRRILLSTHM
jgi:hypothetical protein